MLYCALHHAVVHVLRVGRILLGALGCLLCLLARLLLRRRQDLLHALVVSVVVAKSNVLEARPAVRIFTGKCLHEWNFSDLGPAVLALLHLLLIVLHPPEPILEQRTDHDRVVALSDDVLVNDVRWWIHECIALSCVVRQLL